MTLVDDVLVRKYFGTGLSGQLYSDERLAFNVLYAMERPIKRGDRYIFWTGDKWMEHTMGDYREKFHPKELRLPDRFQVFERECDCLDHRCCVCLCHKLKP